METAKPSIRSRVSWDIGHLSTTTKTAEWPIESIPVTFKSGPWANLEYSALTVWSSAKARSTPRLFGSIDHHFRDLFDEMRLRAFRQLECQQFPVPMDQSKPNPETLVGRSINRNRYIKCSAAVI